MLDCEFSLFLTWSSTCVTTNSTGEGRFTITDTKLYVPVVTTSTQDNAKLRQQLKFGFRRTITWNKYQSDPKTYAKNRYLNHLVNPRFLEVNRLFALSFKNGNGRTSHSNYYLPKVEIKDYKVMIDGKNFFDQPINSELKTYENIRKVATGPRDDYTTWCLLDYSYFKEKYKIIAIDLSEQQVLDADPTAIQKINITVNLDRAGNTTMFFIIEEMKQIVLDFSQETVKVL